MAKADLHIHTTASDGRMNPRELVQEAASLNLGTIAITDHDTIAAVAKARQEAEEHGVEVLSGVEITSSFGDQECHLLGYGFDLENPSLKKLLKKHQQARVDRARWIIQQLQEQGLQLDIDEVLAEANARNVGRPHIAEILRKKGYVGSIREAFIRYLSDERLGVIKNNYESFNVVIKTLKQAGGVAVLAHPGRMYDEKQLEELQQGGLDGIETKHPSHTYERQKWIETFAEKYNLLETGGSDYHGEPKNYYRHFGTLTAPRGCVEKINKLAQRRKEVSI